MKRTILATIALMALAAGAVAQQPPPPGPPPPPTAAEVQQACAQDEQALCPNAQPGVERRQCLLANIRQVSPGCRAAFNAARVEGKNVRMECAADFQQFCAGAQGPARMQCLKQNMGQLSPGCQSALAALPQPPAR